MEEILLVTEEKMQNAIITMEERFLNVRAGRANPSMLDKVMVDYYGVATPIKSLANISVPSSKIINILLKSFPPKCK